ncbi:MAG: hypothetical protein NC905_03785 [Candidatus Omnitrophica bacterium]|nr:hypothetical protein [Candidatus Omnitrophota bacterium]MCM8777363.1 hypothetical protein [Candidatus Omnitrophota bacterium]
MIKLSIATRKLEDIEGSPERIDDFFTVAEQKNCKITLAGKLAAKDAFLKNIVVSKQYRFYKKIEINKQLSGRPFIKILDSHLSQKLSGYKVSLSISHTKEEAVAICVLYK